MEKNDAICNTDLAYEENPKIQLLIEHCDGPFIHDCTNPQYFFFNNISTATKPRLSSSLYFNIVTVR